ncbi:MAG: NADH-quinone oxidoreductase subunit K [Spirochaetales bacterium]|nr:NADH-quinone oxidoreductase subunit K [Spirochaetales bacterium]
MIARILVGLLLLTGLATLVARRNLVKKVFGLAILNSAAVFLFVMEGAHSGQGAPIVDGSALQIVDPLPQALMLTAIVIGVCVTALALAIAARLHRATGSLDIDVIKERLGNGHD